MIVFSDTRYINVETIHRTASSQLLRCFDTERTVTVLMRVFFTNDDAEKSLILTEAAVLRKFNHPTLAAVYDVGTTSDEYPFCTFEDVGGTPVRAVPNGRFHTKETLAPLVQPVLMLMAEVHALYRVLMCIRPDSIRLTGDTKSNVRLALDAWLPTASIPLKTVQEALPAPYFPPALSTGRLVDGRADLYSLGVTLYEVLTGASFSEIAAVDAPGMVSHLLVKSLTENAPALSSDLANALGIWLSGLVEADRSMRFTSAREAASFLASRGIFAEDTLADIPETPAVYAAVHPIGVEAALGAVVDFHFEDTELPVVELSGEAGIGKTMFLKSLVHGQAAIQRNSNYLQALYISAFESKQATAEPSTILATLQTLFDAQKPALLLIDDAEHLSDEERRAIRDMLDAQSVRKSLASVIRIVAAHRTQLAVLGGKSHTLSRFTASQLTAMCSEILGRCAFTPDIYKDLYNATKGHPLFVEELLRHLVRSQAIVRVQRVWTVQENFGAALKAATSLPSLLAWHFKNCSEAAQHLLATLAVLAKPVPLYELAEALDISTQAVMSVLLPLVFDGYIRFEQAYASISHEIYREAITESLAQQIAILQTATSQQTAPHLEPRQDENTAQETPIPSPSLQVESNLSLLSLTGGIFSGTSAAVQRLRRQIELTAQYDIPALLEGQLGTGKEEIASLIHALSKRSTAPFHAVVCTDFSPAELEQYLFNGSTNLIAQTQGGTIFLDDIASATQAVQAKLARLAQARLRTPSRLQHINTLSTQVTDVRILLGCDRNGTGSPEQAMQEGRLYPELFFAVSSMRVIAPSLDERREDIPAIASYFLTQTAQEFASVELTPLTDGVMKSLSERRWTGNVMELESVVRRMVLSSGGIEDIASLYAPQPARMQNGLDISLLSIDEAQKAHILRALELTGGNKTKAAEMLAIKRTTLIARMKKFGMMP